MPDMKIFAGNATPELAKKIADRLYIGLGEAKVGSFSDGEISVEITENVRGADVFIIQSTCAPTNNNLMELIVMVDALRRASAGRITAVMPYFGYARQDRRVRSARVPITAKVVADFLSSVGVDRVLTVDLHAEQIQGFFDVPVDNVFGTPILLEDMQQKNLDNPVVVSPDIGGVVRARAVAKLLDDADLAIIDKRRPKANVAQVMHIIGDVEGRDCIIVDDMIDTGGTLAKAAAALKDHGAKNVYAYATHPVLSGNAAENLKASVIDEVIVTDSIPLSDEILALGDRVRQLTLSGMLSEAIRRVSNEESISAMFEA
ncbi:MAG: ribose-phosphate pyrophosphokinase [Thalassotalea sp.]|nr:ribose-phosphate pyrophosphokinase [Thalassotalea sp.]